MPGTTPTHNPENDGSGLIIRFWGGEERKFRLNHKALAKLQAATDKGPEELFVWIGSGRWTVPDLRHTLRVGLIGGGADDLAAEKLMKAHFDETVLMQHKTVALDVLHAILVQPKDDELPKAKRGREQNRRAKSPSATESEQPARSA